MLNTAQPTAIVWGEHAICLYNDAYSRSLGIERNRESLGESAHEAWAEIWPLLGPPIDYVLRSGEETQRDDQPVDIVKDGRQQETFWTYNFRPIYDLEQDRVSGVLIACTDTTDRVLASRTPDAQQSYSFFDRLPGFVGVLRGPDHVYNYVNASYEAFVGRYDLIGHSVRDRFPELDGQGFFEMLDGVYATGKPVVLHAVPIRFTGENPDQFMDLRYDPTFDKTGAINGIFVSGHDLTERVLAETRRQVLAELSEQLRNLATPSDIAFAAAQLLGRAMQVSRAGYGTIDVATDMLHVDRDWCAPGFAPLPAKVPLREYGSFIDDLKRGTPVAIPDVERDDRTRFTVASFTAQRVRAFANIPVIEMGALVAILYLSHADIRAWSDEDMAFIREFADRTRTAVERSRSDLALRALTASLEKQVEQRTRERDRLWETSEDLLAVASYDDRLLRVSPSWMRSLGFDEQTILAGSIRRFVHPGDIASLVDHVRKLQSTGRSVRFESRLKTRDGVWRWIAWSLVPEPDVRRFNAVGRDVTTDREATQARGLLEDQLRQSQKMEAVGQLTGGIAHDFNNMILGITGSLQIATRRLAQGRADEIAPFMARAKTAADRAAALTHRLLAFSRRQPLDPRPIDANALITSLEDLFRGTIGEHITLDFVQTKGLWTLTCDPNQLENSLLNLVLNARDAMPDGGKLTIATGNTECEVPDMSEQLGIATGQYVCICVRDTGIGMDAATVSKAFDPFFTTKSVGRGTGLGLSMIYGFARQSGGAARIDSELGGGTSVTLYLPRASSNAIAAPSRTEVLHPITTAKSETILLVEDDAIVRSVVVEELTEAGYRVLQADDGHSGLALLQSTIPIDLLVTDIGLPGFDGRHLANEARKTRPALKILFMTGYAEVAAGASGFLADGMALITKPFVTDDLLARIKIMVDI
ncbi:PAS domain-containing protein [Sphingomonas sp. R86520]|uniref:GAF domain-containing hybrid sensor histidine kinase/response regulator n=1 Tax=Sphingomonas sp. R86520 TaxID=3093859 RepID=UPI0036D33BC8